MSYCLMLTGCVVLFLLSAAESDGWLRCSRSSEDDHGDQSTGHSGPRSAPAWPTRPQNRSSSFAGFFYGFVVALSICLWCFGAVGWAAGRASAPVKNLSGGVLAWLSV